MNLELYIARRLVSGKTSKGSVSRRLVSITILGISLGLAVMIISVAVVTGFKKEVTEKVIGFGAHIQIENMDSNTSYETNPIDKNQDFLPELQKNKLIKNIQVFGIKAGIMKTRDNFQGIVLKGVDNSFDWSFFKKNLIEGILPRMSDSVNNEILISKTVAQLLKLKTGDDVALFFIQEPVKMRRMHISGLYETGLGDLDKIYVLASLKQVQQLNGWKANQISGFEINIKDFSKLELVRDQVYESVSLTVHKDGSALRTSSIIEKYTQIFDWINLQNINVIIIIVIMLVVAGFNMISNLLILILERTQMIGLLTSLGSTSFSIRKIFLFQSSFLIIRGLILGNLFAISLLSAQKYFKLIKLDVSSYFIDSVPVNFNLIHLLIINLGTLIAIIVMLIIPSLIISKISPAVTLKYD